MSDTLERIKAALADRYAIERELGRGGMAVVYLAHDVRHDRKVAIKVLRPELSATLGAERFLREIKIAAKLTHPHILTVHESGDADGLLYYVMPYVEGESLRDRLIRERQLPLEDSVRIAREVAAALSHAHDQGVIHRDIKPENILLSGGEAVVADFGIARAVTAAGGEQLTETGMAVGTPAYMSPEQATAQEVDGRSDIYSLACVLYEMVGGDPPYAASTPTAVLARKLTDPVPSLRAVRRVVSSSLEAVVVKALERDAVDRYQTAELFAEALHSAGDDTEATVPVQVVARVKKKRAVYAVLSVVAIAVLAWAGSALLRSDSHPSSSTGSVAFGLERLAVLPFQNLTGDTAQDYLIDGIVEELTSELAKASALEVRSRTSAMRYRSTELSVSEIGRELGVDGLVEGSVMGWGDTVRVVVQLVDATQGAHRWSREYAEPYARLPTIPDQMARDLKVELLGTPEVDSVAPTGAVTDNIVAYELYRRGRRELYRVDRPDGAISLFEQAIEEDSSFAEAWAGLADAHSYASIFDEPREHFDQAHEAVLHALRLDPELPEARATLGVLRSWFEYEYDDAVQQFERALQIDPSNVYAHVGYGDLLGYVGRAEEAVQHLRLAQQLSPADPVMTADLATVLMMTDRCADAEREAERAVAMDPTLQNSTAVHSMALLCLGRYEDAIRELEPLMHTSSLIPTVSKWLGHAYGKVGRREEALRMLRLQEGDLRYSRGRAWVLLGLGRIDEAVEAFKDAIGEREPLVVQDMRLWIWKDLQEHPGYHELLRLVKLDEYVM